MTLLDLQGLEATTGDGGGGGGGGGYGDTSGLSLLICGGNASCLSLLIC